MATFPVFTVANFVVLSRSVASALVIASTATSQYVEFVPAAFPMIVSTHDSAPVSPCGATSVQYAVSCVDAS